MEKIEWRTETRRIGDLVGWELNPRQLTRTQASRLRESLESFGYSQLIEIEPDNTIIDGHSRDYVMMQMGLFGADKEVEVRVSSRKLSIEERKKFAALRHKGAVGEWDYDAISNLYEYGELRQWGFSEDELASHGIIPLTDEPPEDPGEQVGIGEELRKAYGVEVGQTWRLGDHLLRCGDCTNPAVLDDIMRKPATLLFTSPPYWVGMDYETQQSEFEIDEFIAMCASNFADHVSIDYGRIVINTGTAAIHRIEKDRKVEVLPLIYKWQMALRDHGWLARHYRVWAKGGGFATGRVSPKTDAVDQHWETITTFEHERILEPQYLGTFWNPAGYQRGQERVRMPWAQQGVWSDIAGNKSADGMHVAAFPIELPERNIKLYSKPGEIVLDPMVGSGTTLIASERLGRRCVAIELDPNYCAVVLERWSVMVGIKPTLE